MPRLPVSLPFGMTTEFEMERTKSGTIITCGIEYNEFPPPKLLVKAMKKKRTDPLINDGLLRIQNIEYFKKWENKLFGDPNDGEGLYHLTNHSMQMGSEWELKWGNGGKVNGQMGVRTTATY